MGRQLKRVALDFDWPLNRVWKGFINPHFKPCPEDERTCFGGYTGGSWWMDAICQQIAMIGSQTAEYLQAKGDVESIRQGGRVNFPHPNLTEWATAPRVGTPRAVSERINAKYPDGGPERWREFKQYWDSNPDRLKPFTQDLFDVIQGLAGKEDARRMWGRAPWEIRKKLFRAAKIKMKGWGECPVCKGEGLDPKMKKKYEAWKEEEPPAGSGYQVWETVSEGSPISPVFATAEALIDWLCQPGDGMRQGYSRQAAEAFVRGSGWVPSMVVADGKMYANIESAKLT
jgi:hypothetical protein